MSERPSLDAAGIEESKARIRELAQEITDLVGQDLSVEEYYAQFLPRVVEALAAVGGAVWSVRGDALELGYHVNLHASSLDAAGEHQQRHGQLLRRVMHDGQPTLIPPHSGFGAENEGANPTELLLVIAPLKVDGQVEAVLEIFQRPTTNGKLARGYLTFLAQMAELASEWLTTHRLRQYTSQESIWQQADRFARAAHESLDLRHTVTALANEAQRLIACDRVTIAVRRGTRCRVESISGQESVNQRANVVQSLHRLANTVAKIGEPLWYAGEDQALAPQVERALHDYLDESHTKTIAVVPLYKPDPAAADADTQNGGDTRRSRRQRRDDLLGVLIVEQIEDLRTQTQLGPQVEIVAAHASRALANSLEYNSLFLLPVWRWLGKARWLVTARTLPKTAAVLGLLAALISVLVFVPARFELTGRGTLKPRVERDVFVDTEGVVAEVLVEHGATVAAGQPLIKLTNTDLEVRLADVLGQKHATAERIAAIDRARHQPNLTVEDKNRLAGEYLQLEQHHAGLVQQHKLLAEKLRRLTIVSPVAGQVITWDVSQKLLHRPVTSGQVLLTVADPKGPWELEVFMPEHRMGHVTAARGDGKNQAVENQAVEYIVATDPTRRLQGAVRTIHAAAETHEEHGHSVCLQVDIDGQDLHDPRPGASATAKIACGTKPLGYVWLHDVYEFVQSRILFYF